MKLIILRVVFVAFLVCIWVSSAYALSPNDVSVTVLQNFLVQKGFLVVTPTDTLGYFGTKTKQALIEYQKSIGLSASGVFGSQTKAKIAAELSQSSVPTIVPSAPVPAISSGNSSSGSFVTQTFLDTQLKGIYKMISDSQRIDQVSNVAITGGSISGAKIAGLTTDSVAEGSNLYWTPARFDARLSATAALPSITSLGSAGATTTFPGGINITGGCVSINGTCLGGTNGLLTSLNGLTTSAQTFATTSDANIRISVASSGSTHTFAPSWSGVLSVLRGGTAISTPVAAGVLLGNYAGTGYQQLATSSLGLLTTNIDEGSNLYWTNTRFDNRLSATTTLPNITTLVGLTSVGSSAATTTFAGGITVSSGCISVGGGCITSSAHSSSALLTCIAASASGTAYTCSTNPTFSPVAGDQIIFKADVANTGSATLNINTTSAVTIKKRGGGTNLVANNLLAGQWSILTYDGTNWQMQGQVGTPSRHTCIIDNDTQSATALTSVQMSGGCEVPMTATIVEVDVWGGTGTIGSAVTSTGTGSINLERYTPNGSATSTILSGNLATVSGQACALTSTSGTCINGTTSSSGITLSTTALSAGDWVRVATATADNTQTWYRVAVVYTEN